MQAKSEERPTMLALPVAVAVIAVAVLAATRLDARSLQEAGARSPDLSAERLTPGARVYAMYRVVDGARSRIGDYRVRLESSSGAAASWRLVQRTGLPGREAAILDSIWLAEDLAPVRQRSETPEGSLELEFRSGGVVGRRSGAGGEVERVKLAFEETRYPASAFSVLVEALPLKEGFEAAIPLYHDRRGSVTGEVRVTGEATLAREGDEPAEVWIVSVDVGGSRATMWIDQESHVELRTRSELPSGDTFEQELTDFDSGDEP